VWEFDELGYLGQPEVSINDVAIEESERRIDGPPAEGYDSAPPLW
jgi:nuclear transport factor 2 (NTF2) superfamily protein